MSNTSWEKQKAPKRHSERNTMDKYTVILLYPDYIADEFGKETYTGWVLARTVEEAIAITQREAAQDAGRDCEAENDFLAVAVFEGHLRNIMP